MDITTVRQRYPNLINLAAIFNHLQSLEHVNLLVDKNGLVGYGQIVATACETVATVITTSMWKILKAILQTVLFISLELRLM
jgi:hypothetical protein